MTWERANGRTIPDGLVIRHTCDNKFCVNPAHLILGSQAENVQDAVERRLHCFGDNHGRRRLNEDQVREIKRMLADGMLHREIVEHFPIVTTSAIEAIADGRTWKHVA